MLLMALSDANTGKKVFSAPKNFLLNVLDHPDYVIAFFCESSLKNQISTINLLLLHLIHCISIHNLSFII